MLPSGRVILVTSKEGIGTVWDYRGRGSMEPLATAPLDTDGWPLIGVNFVFFWNRVTAPRFFRADNGTYREARFEKITTDMRPVALLDRVFSSHEEARAYLERTNPPPRSTNEHVAYSLAGIAALDTIYALVTSSEPTGRLYVLDFQKNAWQLVDSDVHVATDVPYSAATFEKLSSVASSRTSPTIFYVALVKSRLVLRRYAPGEARPRDLLQIPEGGPTGLSVSRLGAPRGAVAVALRPHGADPQSPARAVVVDFGDGAPVSVPVHPGSLRARTSQGEDVWYVGGPELSVWSGTRERRVKMN